MRAKCLANLHWAGTPYAKSHYRKPSLCDLQPYPPQVWGHIQEGVWKISTVEQEHMLEGDVLLTLVPDRFE